MLLLHTCCSWYLKLHKDLCWINQTNSLCVVQLRVRNSWLVLYAVDCVPCVCVCVWQGRWGWGDWGRLTDTNKTVTGLRYSSCQCEVRGERWWVGPLWVNYPWTSTKTHRLTWMTSGCMCVSIFALRHWQELHQEEIIVLFFYSCRVSQLICRTATSASGGVSICLSPIQDCN